MPVFTNHLRRECELLQGGVELLEAYSTDLEQGKTVAPEDLRMAAYVMLVTFESSHLAKEETLLYPALMSSPTWEALSPSLRLRLEDNHYRHEKERQSLMSLRMSIDEYDANRRERQLVSWRLGDFVYCVKSHIEDEDQELLRIADNLLSSNEQRNLFDSAQKLESSRGADRMHSTRMILNRLRKERGLPAA